MPLRHTLELLVLTASVGCAGGTALVDLDVGLEQVVMTRGELDAAGLSFFPDGVMGVQWDAEHERVHSWAANSGTTAHLVGTLRLPGQAEIATSTDLENERSDYDYAAGGAVWVDPDSGRLLRFQHIERHPAGPRLFLSSLGLATSPARDAPFTDLGEIVFPSASHSAAFERGEAIEVGGGAPVVVEDHLYLYYTDYQNDGSESGLAVARAPIAQVLEAAERDEAAPWQKYHDGGWTEPGLIDGDRGGEADLLHHGAQWATASYNATLDRIVVVFTTGTDLWFVTSRDGVRFSDRQRLVAGGGDELFYPSIVPAEPDLQATGALTTGDAFWVYATRSATGGWDRWDDADWIRHEVHVGE